MSMCPASDTHEYRSSCCGRLVGTSISVSDPNEYVYGGKEIWCGHCKVRAEVVLWCSMCNGLGRTAEMLMKVGMTKARKERPPTREEIRDIEAAATGS